MKIKNVINGIIHKGLFFAYIKRSFAIAISYLNLEVKEIYPKGALEFAIPYFNNKPLNVVEIGVFEGENAKFMNEKLNIKKFYLIDPFCGCDIYIDLEGAKRKAHRRNCKWDKTNVWIEGFSEKVYHKIQDNSIDFLYIDGNHEYESVKDDIRLYYKKVKEGGIISGHDIHLINISRAVMDFANKNNLRVRFGRKNDWYIIKHTDKRRKGSPNNYCMNCDKYLGYSKGLCDEKCYNQYSKSSDVEHNSQRERDKRSNG